MRALVVFGPHLNLDKKLDNTDFFSVSSEVLASLNFTTISFVLQTSETLSSSENRSHDDPSESHTLKSSVVRNCDRSVPNADEEH